MLIKSIKFMSLALALSAASSFALSPTSEYQIQTLTQGGPASIKSTAESVYRSGFAEQEVTDTMAEILLQNYTRNDRYYTDALAWTAKALGSTRNSRYRSTLSEVLAKSTDRKLNKHVEQSLKSLPDTPAEAYVPGTINLTAAREKAQAAVTTAAPTQTASQPQGAQNKITIVRPGMSMEEVYALCGTPTATTSHMTGKQFIPFNFKGGDDVITIGLYKGQ